MAAMAAAAERKVTYPVAEAASMRVRAMGPYAPSRDLSSITPHPGGSPRPSLATAPKPPPPPPMEPVPAPEEPPARRPLTPAGQGRGRGRGRGGGASPEVRARAPALASAVTGHDDVHRSVLLAGIVGESARLIARRFVQYLQLLYGVYFNG